MWCVTIIKNRQTSKFWYSRPMSDSVSAGATSESTGPPACPGADALPPVRFPWEEVLGPPDESRPPENQSLLLSVSRLTGWRRNFCNHKCRVFILRLTRNTQSLEAPWLPLPWRSFHVIVGSVRKEEDLRLSGDVMYPVRIPTAA